MGDPVTVILIISLLVVSILENGTNIWSSVSIYVTSSLDVQQCH